MQPLVSITISTYNVENYISESFDCICSQTLKNIEIICIDDGSTDKTLSILNDYTKKDIRIKVIAKSQNEGLAVARNQALTLAKGKYIAFVDGDDLMDLSLFEKAVNLAETNKSDMVLWDYAIFYNAKDLEINKKKSSNLTSCKGTDKIALLKRPAFTWIKLIKTEKARELGIHFPKGLTRQDIPVHWHLVTQIDKISILPERLSYYRQHAQATTHRVDSRLFDLATVMDITKEYLIEIGLYEKYKDEFLRQQLGLLAGMYDKADVLLKPKALQMIHNRLKKEQWQYILNKKPLRWQTRDFYLSIHGVFIAKVRRKMWLMTRELYRLLKHS